jgi:asparagine synthase (glutamine-hydrolysing)
MGGIAAVFLDAEAPIDRARFHRICTAVPYRSPDGIDAWYGDGAAVARLRFVTADVQDRLAVDVARGLVIAFDGRLDNREDLIAMLDAAPADPDAHLVLNAVARWGVDAAGKLVGDFAFVAWDPRNRRALLARDHMGIRPLHYCVQRGRTICASDIASLLADETVPRRPNERVVAQYLACAMSNGTETLFDGISRVPPAHCVAIDDRGATPHRYWSAEPRSRIRLRSDDEYADGCRELLIRSVRDRMRSVSPLAATLSGGIDSSAVALTAHLLVPSAPPPMLFSMVFPNHPAADERPYIDAVAKKCNGSPVLVPPAAPSRSLTQRAHTWMHVPSMASDSMAEGMWNAMHARGFRSALTGAGGDFVYAGSVFHYADLLRSGRVLEFARRYRHDGRAHDTGRGPLALLQAGVWPALPLPVKRALRPIARIAASRVGVRSQPAWLRLPLERPEHPLAPRGGSFALEELIRSLTSGLHSFFLEGSERAGAEALLELRHPLLDVRLMEFVLSIPEDQRRRGPILKFILRQALKDELPPLLAARTTKGDFAHCVWEAIEALGGETFYRNLAIADAGWVDGEHTLRLYKQMRDDLPLGNERYGRHIPEIWMLTAIELWFRAIMEPSWTTSQASRVPTAP